MKRRPNGLFRKYLVSFVIVTFVVLIANGLFEFGFSYQDHKASLIRIQSEQAQAAAAKIEQFFKEIQIQVDWTTQLPWSADTIDQRRFDDQRLLRQVPAITELSQLDASGREELRFSQLALDAPSHADLSREPKFTEAMAKKIYYGPVYFRRESEPYMTLALAGTRREAGVSVIEVNLKPISDVVSQIKVSEGGRAYVVDAEGRLIAHPDMSLVLGKTDMTRCPQVAAARAASAGAVEAPVHVARDLCRREVLTAYAPIAPLGWLMFVELPAAEAYAPLYGAASRSGALLLGGLALAFLANFFIARRMVVPIQAMEAAAARIGAGDLTQRIAIHTGDELEALADRFNRMAEQLQDSYASLERKVDERTHQLELANLAKSRFLAAASHDLRQPLHALGLFVAQLHGHMKSAEGDYLVDRINAAVADMSELFNALLDLSKLDAGVLPTTVTEFPIAKLLKRIESTFAETASEKGLSFKLVPCAAWVRSDIILLERIVLNLVSNAVRYTASGGVVIGCRRRAQTLCIEVWDSGPGIPEDERRNIFGEFYRVPDGNVQSGVGLGLYMVDRLCNLLGHPIELVSTPGKGSRFSVTVPTAAPQERSAELSALSLVTDPLRGKLVAVIDEDARVLDAMSGMLGTWGCRVISAATPKEALADLADEERPDLIISDYHLANGQSGIAAIAELRGALGTTIPAFLMSGDTAPERLREVRESGYNLVHKPVPPMMLRAMMNHLLKSPDVAGDG
jgi:signal transduction histidine kinase/CheY-like chemotaxis protein